MKIVPSGKIAYNTNFKQDSYFIKKITPQERIENRSDGTQKIIGEPVYFSLFTPRRFDEAKVVLKFKIIGSENFRPIIEMGVLNDKTVWRYDLQPVDNEIINKLSETWNKIASDGKMLLQRKGANLKKYDSIDEFIKNPPNNDQTALYNFDLKNNYKIPGYKAGIKYNNKIEFPIRGDFQFYTYIKDEDLDFDFNFSDINKNKDPDPVDVFLYYNNEMIDSLHLDDDGAGESENKKAEMRSLKLKTSGLPEGSYKLELKANDDIITNEIISPQTKISFVHKIRLGPSINEARLYTNSRKIQFETVNPASLQKIKVNDIYLDIDETYKQFSMFNMSPIAGLDLKKGDISISGNGLFSFNGDQLFDPLLNELDSTFDADKTTVNYIVAGYKAPDEQGQWLEAETEFDLVKAYRENGSYNFLISISGLENNGGSGNAILLDDIKIELKGKSLAGYLKKFFE